MGGGGCVAERVLVFVFPGLQPGEVDVVRAGEVRVRTQRVVGCAGCV